MLPPGIEPTTLGSEDFPLQLSRGTGEIPKLFFREDVREGEGEGGALKNGVRAVLLKQEKI
jgi:hypothetical protein